MTLDELKKRATAAEIALIESVERELSPEIAKNIKNKALKFLGKNLPPDRDEYRFNRDAGSEYLKRFEAALVAEE